MPRVCSTTLVKHDSTCFSPRSRPLDHRTMSYSTHDEGEGKDEDKDEHDYIVI